MLSVTEGEIVAHHVFPDVPVFLSRYPQAPAQIALKKQADEFQFPDGHSVFVLAEGRLLNLGCATGHPSFVMSASFTNQVLAQIELHNNAEKIGLQVLLTMRPLEELLKTPAGVVF